MHATKLLQKKAYNQNDTLDNRSLTLIVASD